jgi:hypothetical protein
MALTPDQIRELERLTADIVRHRLPHAGPSPRSAVPGLGDGKMTRGDVEDWLARQDRALRDHAESLQLDILWWAKAAAWIGVVGIAVGAAISLLAR